MKALALACAVLAALPAWAEGRRLALVVGENRGLVSEEILRFAQLDAERVKSTLVEVGGFASDDVELLRGANAESLAAALSRLEQRLANGPVERLYLYISSHSADGELHLAGTRFSLSTLVTFLKQAPVQVGVLVLDACQSGRVTKLKGVKPAGAAPKLEASGVEGRVLISASGADEYAQESEALSGSYFTHYLLAGLRGAADSSRDGKITLDEAYAWAWARTIEATFSTRGGVQRPAYSVDLHGSGQLVMAEPGRSDARLTIDVKPAGHWLIVADASKQLVADLEKGEGPVTLALAPGGYRVQLRTGDAVLEQHVEVPPRGGVTLSGEALERASLLRVARKGGEEARLHLSAGGGAASGLVVGLSAQPMLDVRLRRDAHLFSFVNQALIDFSFRQGAPRSASFEQLEFELRVGAGHRFAWDAASVAISLELGPLLVHQARLPDASTRLSLGLTAALTVEARLRLVGPVEAFVQGTGGGALVKKLIGPTLVPRVSATAGLGVTF